MKLEKNNNNIISHHSLSDNQVLIDINKSNAAPVMNMSKKITAKQPPNHGRQAANPNQDFFANWLKIQILNDKKSREIEHYEQINQLNMLLQQNTSQNSMAKRYQNDRPFILNIVVGIGFIVTSLIRLISFRSSTSDFYTNIVILLTAGFLSLICSVLIFHTFNKGSSSRNIFRYLLKFLLLAQMFVIFEAFVRNLEDISFVLIILPYLVKQIRPLIMVKIEFTLFIIFTFIYMSIRYQIEFQISISSIVYPSFIIYQICFRHKNRSAGSTGGGPGGVDAINNMDDFPFNKADLAYRQDQQDLQIFNDQVNSFYISIADLFKSGIAVFNQKSDLIYYNKMILQQLNSNFDNIKNKLITMFVNINKLNIQGNIHIQMPQQQYMNSRPEEAAEEKKSNQMDPNNEQPPQSHIQPQQNQSKRFISNSFENIITVQEILNTMLEFDISLGEAIPHNNETAHGIAAGQTAMGDGVGNGQNRGVSAKQQYGMNNNYFQQLFGALQLFQEGKNYVQFRITVDNKKYKVKMIQSYILCNFNCGYCNLSDRFYLNDKDMRSHIERSVILHLEEYTSSSQNNQATKSLYNLKTISQNFSNKGQFSNQNILNVLEEIRNPLHDSIIMLEMLSKKLNTSLQQNFSVPALTSNYLLLNTLNNLFDIIQIDNGIFNFHLTQFNIRALMEECIALFKLQADLKGFRLTLDVDPKVPNVFYTDYIRVKQVITNLLSNAVKFTMEGSITLKCQCMEQDEELLIIVEDTGIGISADYLEKVLELYKEAVINKCDINSLGSGLGLTLSNILVKNLGHNKKLIVQSSPQGGTKFSFHLANQKKKDSTTYESSPYNLMLVDNMNEQKIELDLNLIDEKLNSMLIQQKSRRVSRNSCSNIIISQQHIQLDNNNRLRAISQNNQQQQIISLDNILPKAQSINYLVFPNGNIEQIKENQIKLQFDSSNSNIIGSSQINNPIQPMIQASQQYNNNQEQNNNSNAAPISGNNSSNIFNNLINLNLVGGGGGGVGGGIGGNSNSNNLESNYSCNLISNHIALNAQQPLQQPVASQNISNLTMESYDIRTEFEDFGKQHPQSLNNMNSKHQMYKNQCSGESLLGQKSSCNIRTDSGSQHKIPEIKPNKKFKMPVEHLQTNCNEDGDLHDQSSNESLNSQGVLINKDISELRERFPNIYNYFKTKKKCACPDVLLIDNNIFSLVAIQQLVQSYCISIDVIRSSVGALQMIMDRLKNYQAKKYCCPTYKIIISDIDLPELNGFQLVQEVLELYKSEHDNMNSIFVACTAFISEENGALSRRAGFKRILSKPVSHRELEKIFQKYLK